MHILFMTDNFPPEGNAIASRVYERACYWVKWGHQVTVVTSVPNFPEGKVYPGYQNKFYQVEIMNGIRVVRIKTFITKNKGFYLRILDFLSYIFPAFLAGLFVKKPDVIVATTPQFFVGITAWLLSLCRRLPFVLEVADIWPASIVGVGAMQKSLLIRMLEKLELFLYRQASSIVVLTDAFKKNLTKRHINPAKISVVINGVELSQYQPQSFSGEIAKKYNIDESKFIIGYIGTHGMAHALMNVLHTAQLLQDPNILILFVGAGAERDTLMQYAKTQQINNVKFIEAQPKKIITQFWSLCQVALVHLKNDPVFAEVIPSKIFEAMAMGLPILLAAPKGEASQIIENTRAGLWVDAENSKELAHAINTLHDDMHLRLELANNSLNSAIHFSREEQAKKMLLVLEQEYHKFENSQEVT